MQRRTTIRQWMTAVTVGASLAMATAMVSHALAADAAAPATLPALPAVPEVPAVPAVPPPAGASTPAAPAATPPPAAPSTPAPAPAVPAAPSPAEPAPSATPAPAPTAPVIPPTAEPAPAVPALPTPSTPPAAPAEAAPAPTPAATPAPPTPTESAPPAAAAAPASKESTEAAAPAPAPATAPTAAEPVTQPVAATPAGAATTQVATTEAATTQPSAATTQLATTGPATTQSVASTQPVDDSIGLTNEALAERVATMASGILRSQENSLPIWQYSAALLEAATRLDPTEPRYAQFLVEACTHCDDPDATLKALANYRKIRPDDEFAQVQQIDLYLSRMEDPQKKIAYLNQIIEAENQVGPAVRSVAACRAAQVHAERLENTEAWKAVNLAFDLNPLNLDALKMKYEALRHGRPEDRVAGLLRMLLSNPSQPAVTAGVARELANVGNVKRSIEWFNMAVDLDRRMGIDPPPTDVGIDFACEVFLSGDAKLASRIAADLTARNPDDLNAWLLRLIVAKNMGDKPALEQVIKSAEIALGNRLATISKAAGNSAATTRPIDSPDPVTFADPGEDAKRIAASGQKALAEQFVPAAGGVAFLKIYFEEKPAQALPWIRAMQSLVGESDEVVQRLMGWSYLKAGNADEARSKLKGIADNDGVAALGLIQLDDDGTPAGKAKAQKAGQELFNKTPSGLQGALLFDALAPRGVKVEPTESAAVIEKLLGEYPKDWMKLIDSPEKFYTLRLEPVPGGVGVGPGEPLLVEVTISNTGQYPLTVGPDGVIHPDLWVDAQLRGAVRQVFPAEAYARVGGPMVLLPKAPPIVQTLRLDQGQLQRQLEQFPTAPFNVTAAVMTNPMFSGGGVGLGPSGQTARLSKLMERRAASPGQAAVRDRLFGAVDNGTPVDKVRAIETLAKFAGMMAQDPTNEGAKQMSGMCAEAVHRGMSDTDPAVRAWSTYVFAISTGDKSVLPALMSDSSWIARAVGVVAVDAVGESHDLYKPLAQSDPDPLVKKLAAAAVAANIHRALSSTQPAATQPSEAGAATQPAQPGQPAASPTTGPVTAAPTSPTSPTLAADTAAAAPPPTLSSPGAGAAPAGGAAASSQPSAFPTIAPVPLPPSVSQPFTPAPPSTAAAASRPAAK